MTITEHGEEYEQELKKQQEFAVRLREYTEAGLEAWLETAPGNPSPNAHLAFAALAALWFQWARHYGKMSGEQEGGR